MRLNDTHKKKHGKEFLLKDFWMSLKVNNNRILLAGTDIHTLSKQMGNGVRMLEQYYSKLTATMAAERLA